MSNRVNSLALGLALMLVLMLCFGCKNEAEVNQIGIASAGDPIELVCYSEPTWIKRDRKDCKNCKSEFLFQGLMITNESGSQYFRYPYDLTREKGKYVVTDKNSSYGFHASETIYSEHSLAQWFDGCFAGNALTEVDKNALFPCLGSERISYADGSITYIDPCTCKETVLSIVEEEEPCVPCEDCLVENDSESVTTYTGTDPNTGNPAYIIEYEVQCQNEGCPYTLHNQWARFFNDVEWEGDPSVNCGNAIFSFLRFSIYANGTLFSSGPMEPNQSILSDIFVLTYNPGDVVMFTISKWFDDCELGVDFVEDGGLSMDITYEYRCPNTPELDCSDFVNDPEGACLESDLFFLDCDDDGWDTRTECNNGRDPLDPCSHIHVVLADEIAFIVANPNSGLALADCDGGGESNIDEINNGTDFKNPNDDN